MVFLEYENPHIVFLKFIYMGIFNMKWNLYNKKLLGRGFSHSKNMTNLEKSFSKKFIMHKHIISDEGYINTIQKLILKDT